MKTSTLQHPTMTLPIFPLPVFLLPEGVTKLRIFEPRYLKMVSIASSNQGFVICLNSDNNLGSNVVNDSLDNKQWGSWVDIINFDQGDDGILEIDVKCRSLVEINTVEQDSDKLYFGNITHIKHWSQQSTSSASAGLSTSLASVFAENPSLNDLYPQKGLNDSHWVVARWLELLPIELAIKSGFVANYDFQAAKEFVESVIFKEI